MTRTIARRHSGSGETGDALLVDAVHLGERSARLHSAAPDRATYLQRPDFGRKLDEPSRQALARLAPGSWDLALIVADGLSALAVRTSGNCEPR